jgi:hypothetical protein
MSRIYRTCEIAPRGNVALHHATPEIAMSFAPESESAAPDTLAKPEVLLRVPMGLASPLWGLFAGAAVSGAAWWWMTRWARAENLEAMFGGAKAVVAPEPAAFTAPALEVAQTAQAVIEAVAEPVVEAVAEAAPESAPAPVAEALAEAAPEPVLEALVEATPELEPVGGESAPISPVVEALTPDIAEPALEPTVAAPKPKKKAAAPPAADVAAD